MRYILNSEGYIEAVTFGGFITCNNNSCTEYTGSVPSGYETLEEWNDNANIQAYKIEDGNLVYDSDKDAELQALWQIQEANNKSEIVGNKVTTIDSTSTDTQYPSAKAVYNAISEGGGSGTGGDSIPTGSVIGYTGDTIPEGYEEVENVTDFTLSNLPTTTLVSNYSLKKTGNIVSLNIECIWIESLTINAWAKLGLLPTELYPVKSFSSVATILDAQTGNIVGYGRILVGNDGNINVKSTITRSAKTGIAFSTTWIVN